MSGNSQTEQNQRWNTGGELGSTCCSMRHWGHARSIWLLPDGESQELLKAARNDLNLEVGDRSIDMHLTLFTSRVFSDVGFDYGLEQIVSSFSPISLEISSLYRHPGALGINLSFSERINTMSSRIASLAETADSRTPRPHLNFIYFFGGNLSHLRGQFEPINNLLGHTLRFDALGLVDHGVHQTGDPRGWHCKQIFDLND